MDFRLRGNDGGESWLRVNWFYGTRIVSTATGSVSGKSSV